MQVSLVDYTGKGQEDPAKYAASLLIFSKNTRLTMDPAGFNNVMHMTNEEQSEQISYMANTIPSSWEFVHYTFLITGVTRAFTHQFVRTRTASYAQQTMRVLDVSEGRGWEYLTGPSIEKSSTASLYYQEAMDFIATTYKKLISIGAKVEDARGLLPTNILTNIMVSMNMRTLAEMVQKRTSPRTQGEYRDVLDGLYETAVSVHPFLSVFTNQTFLKASKDLDTLINEVQDPEKRTRMLKLVDQLRQKGH